MLGSSTMRISPLSLLAFGIVVPAALAQAPTPDLKIVTQFTTGRQPPSTTTQYVKGPRSRIERDFAGHPRVTINQCDQHQVVQLDPAAREYTSYQLDDQGRAAGTRVRAAAGTQVGAAARTTAGARIPPNARPIEPSGGTLVVNIETTDTGERKRLFGYEARHVIEKETRTPGPGAIARGQETVRDGRYIDLDFNAGCAPKRKGAFGLLVGASFPRGTTPKFDKIEVHRKGVAETGFAVSLATKTTVPRPNADPFVSESLQEVVELSNAPLDPALFDVPKGYKKVERLPDYIAPNLAANRQPAGSTWDALKRYWASFFR
jgi:hypothetical protein